MAWFPANIGLGYGSHSKAPTCAFKDVSIDILITLSSENSLMGPSNAGQVTGCGALRSTKKGGLELSGLHGKSLRGLSGLSPAS